MNWRAHMFIGGVFALVFFYLMGTRDISLLFMTIIGALSALMPDLDHDMSKGRKIANFCFGIFSLALGYSAACMGKICIPSLNGIISGAVVFLALMGGYFVLFMIFKPKHRGITHTILACFVFGVLVYLIAGFSFAIAGFLGYFSHLVADRHIKIF